MTTRYQKRHYEDVARLLKYHLAANTGPDDARLGAHRALEILSGDFARLFDSDNPLFDRDRFLAACGLDDAR